MATNWQRRVKLPSKRDLAAKIDRLRTDLTLWRQKRAYRRGRAAAGQAQAAFVVGCQRSGTDMVLWTLDRSMDVDRYDEDHRAAFRDCRIRPVDVRNRLLARSLAKRVLFKPVCDSHRTAELLDAHPGSRAIWVYRDYRDLANSAVQRWGDMNRRFIVQLATGGGDWGRRQWNRELVTPEREEMLHRLVDEDINAHTAAAVFWLLVNNSFFSQALERDSRVMLARYEDLVTGPKEAFSRICRFLGVAYDDGMVANVFQTSVKRKSREPIGPAVSEACEAMQARLDAILPEQHAYDRAD